MSRINVCLVAPLPPPYGGIAHWSGLVTRYAASRSDVQITVVNTAPRWRSIHDLSIVKRVIGGGGQMLRDLFVLLRRLLADRIDVVHLTTSGRLAVVRDIGIFFLLRLFGIPLVYHIRFGRVPDIIARNTLEGRVIKFLAKYVDAVIAIDESTGVAIHDSVPSAFVKVIPNCVDFTKMPLAVDAVRGCKVVLFVGWVVPAKGIAELLSSWMNLQPDGWRLHIAGPADSEYVRTLVKKFSTVGVDFLGELSHGEVLQAMANADLFVLPSYTEGFPNAVVEAMALGCPIVSTRVGAIPEMLDDGQCGLLVEPRDVVGLTSALKKMFGSESLRRGFGQKAAVRARDRYSIDSVFASYFSLWGSLI